MRSKTRLVTVLQRREPHHLLEHLAKIRCIGIADLHPGPFHRQCRRLQQPARLTDAPRDQIALCMVSALENAALCSAGSDAMRERMQWINCVMSTADSSMLVGRECREAFPLNRPAAREAKENRSCRANIASEDSFSRDGKELAERRIRRKMGVVAKKLALPSAHACCLRVSSH